MGLYSTSYVILGYHLDKKFIEKHNIMPYDIMDELPTGMELVYDQVSDEYIVFGHKLHSTHQHETNEITRLRTSQLTPQIEKTRDTFIETFGIDVYNDLEHKEPQLLAFTHYS